MNLLLDTHLLLWAAGRPAKLPDQVRRMLEDTDNTLVFSAASIWEVAIKNGLGRDEFRVQPRVLRRGLLDNDYVELAITSQHTACAGELPAIHKDPFDRILVAQALSEGFTLLTADRTVAQYPGPVRYVLR